MVLGAGIGVSEGQVDEVVSDEPEAAVEIRSVSGGLGVDGRQSLAIE